MQPIAYDLVLGVGPRSKGMGLGQEAGITASLSVGRGISGSKLVRVEEVRSAVVCVEHGREWGLLGPQEGHNI